MSFRNYEYWPNGNKTYKLMARTCDKCGKYIAPNGDWHSLKNCDFCTDCAFLLGVIDVNKYASMSIHYSEPPGINIEIYRGKIYKYRGKIKPWEKPDKDYRRNSLYKAWRMSVFERDGFVCQKCGQSDIYIEAHHIKKFKDYFELRYEVSNGITLCKTCHINEHRKVAA